MREAIQAQLADHPWAQQILYFDSIDSTNTYAKQLAVQGAAEGTVVIADHQTGGRGRLGRSFASPAGMGIYLSVILRPDCRPDQLMHLTCAAGLAASDAVLQATGQAPGIKWTNDLILSRRKLGGILTELSVDPQSGKVAWAIIGIGINCCQQSTDFPPEIRDIAISLGLSPADRPRLAAALIRALYKMQTQLQTKQAETIAAFQSRCVTIGQEVSVLRGDDVYHATATGIDRDGGLIVTLPDGSVRTVTSGEVSIRGMYGYV